MIRYSANTVHPLLFSDLGDDLMLTALSTTVWILCTSSYEQLLVLIYGLYDVYDEDVLDRFTLTSLFSGLLYDDFVTDHLEVTRTKNNERVSELVTELFDYVEATKVQYDTNKDLGCADSCSEDSFDCVASRSSPIDPKMNEGVSCKSFVQFFVKRKRGTLWKLLTFQKKLQEVSFGAQPWAVVNAWALHQPNVALKVEGPRLNSLTRGLLSDVAKHTMVNKSASQIEFTQHDVSYTTTHEDTNDNCDYVIDSLTS